MAQRDPLPRTTYPLGGSLPNPIWVSLPTEGIAVEFLLVRHDFNRVITHGREGRIMKVRFRVNRTLNSQLLHKDRALAEC